MADGGDASAATAKAEGTYRTAEVTLAFNKTNQAAVDVARAHALQLSGNISAETRRGIQALITTGFEKGVTVQSTSRLIRGSIGLTEKGSKALVNAQQRLQTAKPGTLVRLGKKKYRIPKGGLSAAKVDSFTAKYSAKLLNDRAKLIARTETIRAANEGQRQLWIQAQEQGLLTGNELREWIITPDDRLCPECEAMEGQLAAINEPFESPDTGEQLMGPPLHPDCRCAVGLTTKTEGLVRPDVMDILPIGTPSIVKEVATVSARDRVLNNVSIGQGVTKKKADRVLAHIAELPEAFVKRVFPVEGEGVALRIQTGQITSSLGTSPAALFRRELVAGVERRTIILREVKKGKALEDLLRHEMGHAFDATGNFSSRIKSEWLKDTAKFGKNAGDRFVKHYALNEREAFAQSTNYLLGKRITDAPEFRRAFKNSIAATKKVLNEAGIETLK